MQTLLKPLRKISTAKKQQITLFKQCEERKKQMKMESTHNEHHTL